MTESSDLKCVQVHPRHVMRRHFETPFEARDGFTQHWWNAVPYQYDEGGIEYFSFTIDGEEVGRAQVLLGKSPGSMYLVPRVAGRYVEIAFFEVSLFHQKRDLGTRAIEALVSRYPDFGVLAYSEEADGFWDSLGWTRYEHSTSDRSRPLYVLSPG